MDGPGEKVANQKGTRSTHPFLEDTSKSYQSHGRGKKSQSVHGAKTAHHQALSTTVGMQFVPKAAGRAFAWAQDKRSNTYSDGTMDGPVKESANKIPTHHAYPSLEDTSESYPSHGHSQRIVQRQYSAKKRRLKKLKKQNMKNMQ